MYIYILSHCVPTTSPFVLGSFPCLLRFRASPGPYFFLRTIMASRPLCDECYAENDGFYIWQCVKTHGIPCSSHQNSWVKMDVNNPLKMYL